MNTARADQERLTPSAVECRNIRGEGHDGGGKAVERSKDATQACARLRELRRVLQRRRARPGEFPTGSPTVRNMISACAWSATTFGARPPAIVPILSVLWPSRGSSGSWDGANGAQSIEQRMNRGVAQLGISGVRKFSVGGDFVAQHSLCSERELVFSWLAIDQKYREPRGLAAATFAPALLRSSPTTKSSPKFVAPESRSFSAARNHRRDDAFRVAGAASPNEIGVFERREKRRDSIHVRRKGDDGLAPARKYIVAIWLDRACVRGGRNVRDARNDSCANKKSATFCS